jgi:hypothetical protein
MSAPSICIPRIIDDKITKDHIYKVFNKYNWGPISRIDLVKKNNNTRAFIHFKYWFENKKTACIREKLKDGGSINIIYAKPWFWKCRASNIPSRY